MVVGEVIGEGWHCRVYPHGSSSVAKRYKFVIRAKKRKKFEDFMVKYNTALCDGGVPLSKTSLRFENSFKDRQRPIWIQERFSKDELLINIFSDSDTSDILKISEQIFRNTASLTVYNNDAIIKAGMDNHISNWAYRNGNISMFDNVPPMTIEDGILEFIFGKSKISIPQWFLPSFVKSWLFGAKMTVRFITSVSRRFPRLEQILVEQAKDICSSEFPENNLLLEGTKLTKAERIEDKIYLGLLWRSVKLMEEKD